MTEKQPFLKSGDSEKDQDLQALVESVAKRSGRQLKVLIVGAGDSECLDISSLLDPDRYLTTTTLVSETGSVVLGESNADIHIICLPENFYAIRETDGYFFPTSSKPLLYTTSDTSDKIRLWAFRHGASDLLVYPFNSTELQIRIERLVAGDLSKFERYMNEKVELAFLRFLLDANVRSIEPVLEPAMPYGHFYPDVARVFGRTSCDVGFLEKLAQEGILARQIANRIRVCPLCAEVAINYRETCPRCASLDIKETEVVHHFSCGHVGPLDSFRQGANLVCPKCEKTLRHIGLDYEKPIQHLTCGECEYIFTEPTVEAQCLQCGFVSEPAKMVAKDIFRYELTSVAQQAINEQRIGGLNLSSLLRSTQTGLYSKQFFEHEAEREIFRSGRTGSPFCLMLIRVDDFDHIRLEHAAQAANYVSTIFNAINSNLRILDVTCVWGTDLLAVLLPETKVAGGGVVAVRMKNNVKELEYLYSIHQPGITVSLAEWNENYKNHTEMFQEMYKDLGE